MCVLRVFVACMSSPGRGEGVRAKVVVLKVDERPDVLSSCLHVQILHHKLHGQLVGVCVLKPSRQHSRGGERGQLHETESVQQG